MNTATIKVSISTPDPYTGQALLNPWPLYRELRDTGPGWRNTAWHDLVALRLVGGDGVQAQLFQLCTMRSRSAGPV
jgi:hypothetical protein